MARFSPRARIRLTVTALFGAAKPLVCLTRDVSTTGLFLETASVFKRGTQVEMSLLDTAEGEAIALTGEVARIVTDPPGLGIRLVSPPDSWQVLVVRAQAREESGSGSRAIRRLRILVVGDADNRRGALALYVKSGWDVRFASDLHGTEEALKGFRIDAVIVDHDLDDERWPRVLEAVRIVQPGARRIVRSPLRGSTPPPAGRADDLVHRVVDQDAGMESLLEALTREDG